MSALTICYEDGLVVRDTVTDHSEISAALKGIGVRFERRQIDQGSAPEACSELSKHLEEEYGVRSMDMVSLWPGHPEKEALRRKFLAEHTHSDFEVRFFLEGSGLFFLHSSGLVFMVLCERGDLISIPPNLDHWFDMGDAPNFTCIRFFNRAEGWLADYTDSGIATKFPSYDEYVAAL